MKNKPMRKSFIFLVILVLVLSMFIGCNATKYNDEANNTSSQNNKEVYNKEDLNEQLVMAAAWYQNSAEMRAISYQSFNIAKMLYEKDLENNESDKKRAVIVDVDETVLDNSPYEAGLIGNNRVYPDGWDDWINSAQAEALPGSVEFLTYVSENNGDVYYITNRKSHLKEATIKNLKDLNFPQADETHVLVREEESDKQPRRDIVLKDHRIVLLMGDNLNDFDSVFIEKNIEQRFDEVEKMKEEFGKKFIVLPNPMYGEWEGALYEYDWSKTEEEKSKARKSSLNRWSME